MTATMKKLTGRTASKSSQQIDPDTIKKACVHAYTDAGFTLFPLGHGDGGKAPVSKDSWPATEYEALLGPADLPYIYGLIIPRDVFIIDVDPRRYKDGHNEWHVFRKKFGVSLKQTFSVRTAGGGFHVYFKKPAKRELKGNGPLADFPAIDLKKYGGYVVAAGSYNNGTPYTIVSGSPDNIAEAPEEMLEYLKAAPRIVRKDRTNDSEAAIRRFAQFCKTGAKPAIEGQSGDATTLKVAHIGRDAGLSETCVADIMLEHYNHRCRPQWTEDELRTKVFNAYQYAQNSIGAKSYDTAFESIGVKEPSTDEYPVKWDLDREKKYRPTLGNCVTLMAMTNASSEGGSVVPNPLKGLLRFNLFSQDIEYAKAAPWHKKDMPPVTVWNDDECIQMKHWLSHHQHFSAGTSIFHEAAVVVSRMRQYHPVRDYLNSLVWDGVERLDEWLITYCKVADNIYSREVGKNTLLAAVARVFEPGCKHDCALIIEGKQGIGKTTLVEILAGEWFFELDFTPKEKDTVQGMQGCWFVELSEMRVAREADVEALKTWISRKTDRARLPYERTFKNMPRQCVFIGTHNPDEHGYLRDRTGNRRFWPVYSGGIRLNQLMEDRDQLFAEAVVRYRSGEKWHIEDEQIKAMAEAEQAKRLVRDAWDAIIHNWLQSLEVPMLLTDANIAYGALGMAPGKISQLEQRRITNAMRKAGYQRKKVWAEDRNVKIEAWVPMAI